jgi:enoyl-CoA hydratase
MAVTVTSADGVVMVTIDRPDAANALDPETTVELGNLLGELAGDPAARCIVVTGAGEKAFIAGADIKAMRGIDPGVGRMYSERGFEVVQLLETMPKPTIAAINGVAFGGGLEIALACDFRYASSSARFGQLEINFGLVPGWGATQRLARATTMGFAKDLIFTGRIVSVEEAYRRGLVDVIADPVLDHALGTGRLLASKSAEGLRKVKELCNRALQGEHAGNLELERQVALETLMSRDAQEGLSAYVEGREPKFS